MTFNPTIARIRNMYGEFKRLNGFMFTPSHIQSSWQMASPSETHLGRPYRFATDVNDRLVCDVHGEPIEVKRDGLDQIIDFVRAYASTYFTNIFKHETCTHPHADVYEEWEGDREYGYCLQHYCRKCHGYLIADEVDRYLPPEDRRPESIHTAMRPLYMSDPIPDEDDHLDYDDRRDYGF